MDCSHNNDVRYMGHSDCPIIAGLGLFSVAVALERKICSRTLLLAYLF